MKKIYVISGTIILGAIGSGLWEILLSPALSWMGSSLWGLLVQLSSSVEQSIFSDIAQRRQETMKMMSGILVILFTLSLLSSFFNLRQFVKDKVDKIIIVTAIVIFFLFSFIMLAKNEYIQERIEDYNHLMVIIKPYTTGQEYDGLNSKFSLIQAKKDYDSIIRSIKDIAIKNGVHLAKKY